MRVSDHRYDQDRRKHNLAMWMISQGARTRTVTEWTGLSRYRVQKLARRYAGARPEDHRRRGISPFHPGYFGRSRSLEAESLAFALMAAEMDVLPHEVLPEARRTLPELDRGERLRRAYEWHRAIVPEAKISLEHAILFLIELGQGIHWVLRRCMTCPDMMVVARVGTSRDQCPFCRQAHRKRRSTGDVPSISADRGAQRR